MLKLYQILHFIFSFIPRWILSKTIYYILKYILKYRKSLIYSNLKETNLVTSKEEINEIRTNYYKVVARYISEIIQHSQQDYYKKQIIKFTNPELLISSLEKHKNVILFASHLGNWELVIPSLSVLTDKHIVGIYKPLSNVPLDRYITKLRSKYGLKLAPMEQILKQFFKPGNRGYVFINDQSPARGASGRWIDMLGRPTYWFNGIEKINQKFDCEYLYIKVIPESKSYAVEFIPINSTDPLKTYVSLLEQDITQYPEYWLWSHNRWKNNAGKNN